MKHYCIGFCMACMCGLFVALAAGVEWGTSEAGRYALLTFAAANLGGCARDFFVYLWNGDGWDD